MARHGSRALLTDSEMRSTTGSPRTVHPPGQDDLDDDPWEMSPRDVKELRRRVADLKDKTRYMLVVSFLPGSMMYYDVSTDCYAWNNPAGGTLFKRKKAAEAIRRLLGSGVVVVECSLARRNGVDVPILPKEFRPRRRRLKSPEKT